MVGADVPGRVGIALRECSHPFLAVQFTPEKRAHFLFLRRSEIVRHIVEDREKVVAVPNLVERSVRLAATPISLAIDIEQAIDSFCQSFCLAAELSGARRVAATFVQIGDDAHTAHVAGIHSGHLMQVGADDLEQILDGPVVGETVSEVGRAFSNRWHARRGDPERCDRKFFCPAMQNLR